MVARTSTLWCSLPSASWQREWCTAPSLWYGMEGLVKIRAWASIWEMETFVTSLWIPGLWRRDPPCSPLSREALIAVESKRFSRVAFACRLFYVVFVLVRGSALLKPQAHSEFATTSEQPLRIPLVGIPNATAYPGVGGQPFEPETSFTLQEWVFRSYIPTYIWRCCWTLRNLDQKTCSVIVLVLPDMVRSKSKSRGEKVLSSHGLARKSFGSSKLRSFAEDSWSNGRLFPPSLSRVLSEQGLGGHFENPNPTPSALNPPNPKPPFNLAWLVRVLTA